MRLLIAFVAAGLYAQDASNNGFVVSGTVVDGSGKRPLSKTLVSLVTSNGKSVGAVTGPDGRFQFVQVPKGKYTLRAETLAGDVQDFRGSEGYSTGIAVGPGLESQGIVFRIRNTASISGRVLDENGEPISQAGINLFRRGAISGKFQVVQQGGTQTLSDGTFVAKHLPPGTYFLVVQSRPWYARPSCPGQTSNAELDVAYPLTYYGGGSDPNGAAPITLRDGDSTAIEIIMRAVPAAHIIMPQSDTQPMQIVLMANGPGSVRFFASSNQLAINKDGQQTLCISAAPGEYVAQAQFYSQDAPPRFSQTHLSLLGDVTLSADQFPRSQEVHGHLTIHGAYPTHASPVVQFSCAGASMVSSDGLFTIPGPPPPEPCQVTLANLPNFVIESMTVNGQNSPDHTFTPGNGGDIEITLTAAQVSFSSLEGVVVTSDKPLAGAMVLLVPANENINAFIPRDQSDSDGTFSLPRILPGKYTLLAIDDGTDLAYREPEVLRPYLAAGISLEFPRPANTPPVKVEVQARRQQ